MTVDMRWMDYALMLAKRGQGRTGRNPSVGCVIAQQNTLIAASHTAHGGRPHAEHRALAHAQGTDLSTATAYVTLEPCAHEGETPSCARLLAESGIGRVVIAMHDPDPRTQGAGIALLRAANIDVVEGVQEAQAQALLSGFVLRQSQQRPHITLKLASSLDGAIATASGHSQWITGESARQMGHSLRATHNAIMVGSGTWKRDSPRLNCRISGLEHASPTVVLLDQHGEITPNHPALASPSLVLTHADHHARLPQTLPQTCLPIAVQEWNNTTLLQTLAEQGIMRLLVEGGATLAASLLRDDVVDELWWFAAPVLLGGNALHAVAELRIDRLADAHQWTRQNAGLAGQDQWIHLVRNRNTG